MADGFEGDQSNGAPPCIGGNGIYDYLNRQDVMNDLHVNVPQWNFCNNEVAGNYSIPANGSIPQYFQLIESGKYTIIIYSGDSDGCVPFIDTEYWLPTFNLNVTNAWRPWYNGDQVAGFVQEYDGLTFVTVKGAGHMVPTFQPEAAYIMVSSIIDGQPLPNFNSSMTITE